MVAKNVKTTVMNSNWMRPFHLHPCPRLEVIVDVDIQAWWYWGVFEENVSRPLIWTWDNGDKQTDVGMTVHINFDLEELLDSQMYCTFWVECDKTAHRLELKCHVHVDLEAIETERKIVHIHEDLRVKPTVSSWSLYSSFRFCSMFLSLEFR